VSVIKKLIERKAEGRELTTRDLIFELRKIQLKKLICDLKAKRLGLKPDTDEYKIFMATCEEEPI